MIYEYTIVIHLLAIISWMAGLFYLPRVMVYHAENSVAGDKLDAVFQTMEYKLQKYIMLPSMIVTLLSGLTLIYLGGVDWTMIWPYAKFTAVLLMFAFHGWLSKARKNFARGENSLTGKQLRIANEVPTILLIIIVISVIIKF